MDIWRGDWEFINSSLFHAQGMTNKGISVHLHCFHYPVWIAVQSGSRPRLLTLCLWCILIAYNLMHVVWYCICRRLNMWVQIMNALRSEVELSFSCLVQWCVSVICVHQGTLSVARIPNANGILGLQPSSGMSTVLRVLRCKWTLVYIIATRNSKIRT
jgi:hypothetical protein